MDQTGFSGVLWEKYPICFKEEVTLDIPTGWNNLVDDMLSELEIFLISISDRYPTQYLPEVYAMNERFGGLKVYMKFHVTLDVGDAKRMNEIISQHEKKSLNTCSVCGNSPAKCMTDENQYLMTLCQNCQGSGNIH